MEHSSVEICESGGQNSNGGNESKNKIWNVDSPKVLRLPLQQVNSPAVSAPQIQTSITPYRYHRCRVIPEEIENQENVNPQYKYMHHEVADHPGQKSGVSCARVTSADNSPFAYPLILEGCQPYSSPSPSYKSSGLPQEIYNGNFESPKTHFTTPYGKFVASESENNYERLQSIYRSNNGRHISNAGATLARGVVSSGHSSTSLTSSNGSNHKCVVTPSKSVCTPSSSDRSVFRTPSDSYGSSSSDSRVVTPQQRCIGYHQVLNPFEVGVDHLQLPTVSPSLFRQVVSPSQKAYENFKWSIDELAAIQPVNIETSPYNQNEVHADPDYERQAQDAIDKFFSRQPVVPSPWTGSNKSVNLLPMNFAPDKPVSCQPTPTSRTVSCQTELSLPFVLPEAVEEFLKPFCTYTQDQWWQANELEEGGSNLNSTTLRRKLLFSQDELVNATPMGSPRDPTSPAGSTSSSPVAPLPLHDDDDGHNVVEDDNDDVGLIWCTDVIRPAFSTSLDLSRRRCEQLSSHNIADGSHPSRNYGRFCSPPSKESIPIPSPDVSPIDGQSLATAPQHRSFSSPNVSPIQQSTESNTPVISCSAISKSVSSPFIICYENAESKLILSPVARNSSPSQNIGNCQTSGVSDAMSERQAHWFKGESGSGDNLSPQYSYEQQNIGEIYHHKGDNHDPSEDNPVSTIASRDKALNILSPESKAFASACRSVPKRRVYSADAGWTEVNQSSPGHVITTKAVCSHTPTSVKKGSREGKPLNYERVDHEQSGAIQRTPTSSKAEKRSSGNSGHFSSSPIRDVLQSPLAVDTPCKKFSDSPPLSPILCRSILIQSQLEQLKAQVQCGQDCQFATGNLSQSTLLSVDMDARSSIEEEVMMDEGISVYAAIVNPGSPLTSNKHFSDTQELSSICDMDTDLQQSLEVNVSHEVKLQESGYQTGSLQSTNFSMSTFTSNSTMCSSASFQKDRLPSIFGNDASSVHAHAGTNNEKRTRNQSGLPYKDRITE